MKIRLIKVVELSEDGNEIHYTVEYKKNIFDFWHLSKSFWDSAQSVYMTENSSPIQRAEKYFDALVETEGQDRFETVLKETEV